MCQVDVRCITDDPHENWAEGVDFGWDDESVDELVDNMVRLIGEDFAFKKEMFIGGLTLAELGRLRALKKSKDKETSEKQEKDTIPESTEAESSQQPSAIGISDIASSLLKDLIGGLEGRVASSVESFVQHGLHGIEKRF